MQLLSGSLGSRSFNLRLLAAAALLPAFAANGSAAGTPEPVKGFTLATFATPPAGLTKPDSLAIVGGNVWIGYGNEGKKDGAEGAMSAIVEYSMDGKMLKTLTIPGHHDGLKVDPATGKVWSLQNEDGNATLIVIDPATDKMENYTFEAASHGGGYDDVVFKDGKAFVTASNPSTDGGKKNPGPSVVRVSLTSDHKITVEPALPGTPTVKDMVSGKSETLNLTDPDSIALAPTGDLVMTSQDDAELLFIQHTSATAAKARVLHLKGGVKVDDTTFASGPHGFLLVSDTPSNVVYKITATNWKTGAAFSAMSGVDKTDTAPAISGYVGALDTKTGELKSIVANMDAPHGLIFVKTP